MPISELMWFLWDSFSSGRNISSEIGTTAYAVLENTVDECLAENGRTEVDRDVLAITMWSLVHGFASLWLDGQLAHHTDDPATLAHQVAALVTSYTTG